MINGLNSQEKIISYFIQKICGWAHGKDIQFNILIE